MSLPIAAAEHPVSVIILYIAVTVTGLISLFKLEINMLPDMKIPAAYIVTECRSLPAEDMEKMVTIPIEKSLSSISGIKEISSISKEGLSSVKLTFKWNENLKSASGNVREIIDTVYQILPYDAGKPLLLLTDLSEQPLLTITALPVPGKTKSDISRIIETEFKSRLLSIDGVSGVRISGLAEDKIIVDVDYPALVNTGLALDSVTSSVSSSVFSKPAGKIYDGKREYLIRAETDIRNISDIRKILLPGKKGLELSDIADIYIGEKYTSSYFHSGGKECIGMEIIKSGNSGFLKTAEKVRAELEKLGPVFKNDFNINIIDDSSVMLKEVFNSLFLALLAGIISALSVLFLFFNNKRSSFTVIISLPFSLSAVFIYMYFSKLSLNLISLTGLIIGSGMVFDNTIVVLDKLMTEKPINAERAGLIVSEAVPSVAGSTITTVLIFLPLAFIPGLSGKLFRDLAFTVIVFLSASAIVSVTIPPSLYILLEMNRSEKEKKSLAISYLKSAYKKYLVSGGKSKQVLILLFLLPLVLVWFLEKEIIPPGYSRKVTVFAEYSPGYSSVYYAEKSMAIEKMLIETGAAEKVYAAGGIDKDSPEHHRSGMYDINTVLFTIHGSKKFKGNNSIYELYIENIFSSLMEYYTLKRAEIRSDDSFLDQITDNRESLRCVLTFQDRKEGYMVFSELKSELAEKKYLNSINGNFLKDNPEYTLAFNKEGFSSAALTQFDAGKLLYNSVKGITAASIDTGGESETDILVRYKKNYTDSPEKISSLRIPLKEGIFDPSAFVKIKFQKNYRTLTRMDRKGCFYLNIIPASGMYNRTRDVLEKYKGRGLDVLSEKEMKKSRKETVFLFLSSLMLIYFFLGAQFESFLLPLFLLFSIPLSISGSFTILFLTGQSLNISSFMGILILSGTTVNTSILIFAGRKSSFYSIKISAEKRLVPACASILTTVTALIPAAIQIRNPLQSSSALSLIGGLLSGGVSVLLIYPVLFDRKKRRCGKS